MEAKKEKIIVSILIGIAIVLWFIQQYLTNQLYYETLQTVNTQQLIQKYEQSNNSLKLRELQLRSYTFIEQEAKKAGYTVQAPIIE